MTNVLFHYNAADPYKLASSLIEDQFSKGRRVLVYAPDPARYDAVNKSLWAFKQLSFVPHCDVDAENADFTPVLLIRDDHRLPTQDVLVILADEVPVFFSRFKTVIDLVGNTEAEKVPGRVRDKFDQERGYPMERFDHAGSNG